MNRQQIAQFREMVWHYYRDHARVMPWRETPTPYYVSVSEMMLQQTQVSRVVLKFEHFVSRFPDWQALASAGLPEVLEVWQGLGYNRRARWLHQLAQAVVGQYDGDLPTDQNELVKLPGIGPNTAGSIAAFAFNQPVVFIETNIRRVFIHHFFEDHTDVSDKQLMPFIEKSLDQENPRDWYYALMDYGSYLVKTVPNPNRKSRHYARQSTFEGSHRQLRGKVLRYFLEHRTVTQKQLSQEFSGESLHRLDQVIDEYVKEKLIIRQGRESLSLID